MKGLKFATLLFVIGLAFCLQLLSTSYVHADGIKTPRPGFTPAEIGIARPTVAPTRIHFAENLPAAKDSTTPNPPSNTQVPTTSAAKASSTPDAPIHTQPQPGNTSSASTPTKSIARNGTAAPILLSPGSTLLATSTTEREHVKIPNAGQSTIAAEVGTPTPASAESGITQKPTLSDVLEVLPENTGIMVLGKGEKPLLLVSQEASQVITEGDPVWCPATQQVPTPGANGCTISYPTLTELVQYAGNSIFADGTIWITSGAQFEIGPITIDGSIYTNWANSSLTLQGGWTGTGTSIAPTNSIFTVPIYVINWNASVAVNNITVDGASGSGLGVTTNGHTITIENSSFVNNGGGTGPFPWGDGADISPNGGNVIIRNSEFRGNNWDGLYIVHSGNIDISNSIINNNGYSNGSGGGLNAYGVNTIDIRNSEFTDNRNYDIVAICNSGYVLLVSYPDEIPPFPRPVRMDIYVDELCRSTAYLVPPTATPSATITATATPTGPTPTATFTPTGTLMPTATPSSTPTPRTATPVLIRTPTFTSTPIGSSPQPTSTPTSARSIATIPPRSSTPGSPLRAKSKGEFFLDCQLQASFTYPLPNGDKVEIVCPSENWSGKASISRLDNTRLPDELPAGFTYASAFVVNISKLSEPVRLVGGEYVREDVDVIPEGGYIKASFVALGQENYSILYWDANSKRWILLKDFMLDEKGQPQTFDLYPENRDNPLKIISGVRQVTNPLDPRVEVSTNFPGIFVLAQH